MGNNIKLNIDKSETGWTLSVPGESASKMGFQLFFTFLGKWVFVGFGAALGLKAAEYILTK